MLCKFKYLTSHFSLLVSHWTWRAVPWVKVLFDPSSHPNLHLCHTTSQINTATRGRSPTININRGCATTYAIHRLYIYVCTTHMIVQHKAETEALGKFDKADVEPEGREVKRGQKRWANMSVHWDTRPVSCAVLLLSFFIIQHLVMHLDTSSFSKGAWCLSFYVKSFFTVFWN